MSPITTRRTGGRCLLRLPLFLALAAALGLALAAGPARAAIEDGYDPNGTPVPTTWFEMADPVALQADRDFVAGMRPHHAGALTMSRDYLADPAASSPVLKALAYAIIRNQRFEIGMLDEVSRNLDQPPIVLNLGLLRLALQPGATEGLAQMQQFIRSPIPGPAEALGSDAPVTARDVQFAKGMTLHHQAALEMARAYHANRAARNGYLGLMNVDIITDQTQEIALMQSVIARYPGDADAVQVDASMIHGMEGMRHGDDHAGHAGMAMPETPAAPLAAARRQPKPPGAAPTPRTRPAPAVAQDHGGHAH